MGALLCRLYVKMANDFQPFSFVRLYISTVIFVTRKLFENLRFFDGKIEWSENKCFKDRGSLRIKCLEGYTVLFGKWLIRNCNFMTPLSVAGEV